MSKPTEDFWNGLGWCLIWIAVLGGITAIIWVGNRFGNAVEKECIRQRGNWISKKSPDGWSVDYMCEFNNKAKE